MLPLKRALVVVLVSVVGAILVVLGASWAASAARLADTIEVEDAGEGVTVPLDEEAIALGEHLVTTRGCRECHGADLSGTMLIDDPMFARLAAPNLTGGDGSATANFGPDDWDRAIRHGVGGDGRLLFIMPSPEYYALSDKDLGDLVAYIKSLPPIDNVLPRRSLGPIGRMLLLRGELRPVAATIDHDAPRGEAPPRGATVAYGAYLANVCMGCHGEGFSGGPIPGGEPGSAPAGNLTPHDETGIGTWSLEDFVETLRTGVDPEGHELDESMPWQVVAEYGDDELEALYLYFNTLPPTEKGNR